MFTISKEFHFSASHKLEGLPEDHPCSRLHGHNYVVTLTLSSPTRDEVGFVLDYRKLDRFKRFIDDTYDHRHLNDIFEVNPTAENMAERFYLEAVKQLPSFVKVQSVTVQETPKTAATFWMEDEDA